jgi:hypothetical protein
MKITKIEITFLIIALIILISIGSEYGIGGKFFVMLGILTMLFAFLRWHSERSERIELEETSEIICPNPNCGYRGKPAKKSKGSTLIGLILLLFGILPGVIYFIFGKKTYYICPKCGIQIREKI